jgi:hypothetical protein
MSSIHASAPAASASTLAGGELEGVPGARVHLHGLHLDTEVTPAARAALYEALAALSLSDLSVSGYCDVDGAALLPALADAPGTLRQLHFSDEPRLLSDAAALAALPRVLRAHGRTLTALTLRAVCAADGGAACALLRAVTAADMPVLETLDWWWTCWRERRG